MLQQQKFVPPNINAPGSEIYLKDDEYTLIANLMFEKSGVFLDRNKITMIQARLSRRLSALGLNNFRDYCGILRNDDTEIIEFVNALTTHKTDFFRENEHFEILKQQILPEICKNEKSRKLRIWSAASSSGEEVYTLAIVLSEFFANNPGLGPWDYKILGTDIDTNVINKAKKGVYSSEVAGGIRPDLLQKYFVRGLGKNSGYYKIKPELHQIIKFRQHNLLGDLADLQGLRFNIVFLRNVLIYFKDETREFVIQKMHESLLDGGYLFVGHSEPLSSITHQFSSLRSAVYKK